MMKMNGASLLEQRALQLAILHLSRRDDLLISPSKDAYGIDLLISLLLGGKSKGRVFGIMVKAGRFVSVKTVGVEQNQFKLPINVPALPEDLPFPLALFVFNMEDDEGYFRWLLAPLGTIATSTDRLSVSQEQTFTRVSPATVDQIISQVNHWYDRRANLTVNGVSTLVSA